MELNIFGLLHIDETQQTAMNIGEKVFDKQISIYVNNAIFFSKTLAEKGINYSLLTNSKSAIENSITMPCDNLPFDVIEIQFKTDVPSGVRFYSAHYKLDAFRYLASLNKGYVALCDLDMVCINAIPLSLQNIIDAEIPLFYDISDQVIPAYGENVIIRDLSVVGELESEGRWAGGEFIAGVPMFFEKLVGEIEEIYGNYISNINSLHHVGDEAFTSVGLERLRRYGLYIADAGTLGIVGRYWNANVLHQQKPFDYFINCFLIHLPADKIFLSSLAQKGKMETGHFINAYSRYRGSICNMMKKKVKLVVTALRSIVANKTNSADGKKRRR